MTGFDRGFDDRTGMALGCALAMAIGTDATNPGGDALVERLAFAVANAALGYAVARAVLR